MRLVAFDLYGTLLDVGGLAGTLASITGKDATALVGKWRAAQLERTWDLNRTGHYEPFDTVTAWALAHVAPEVGVALHDRLVAAWLTLPPYPDAAAALARIGAVATTAVLSNGTPPMIESALAAASLRIDRIRSVDEVKVYKTDPRVYALLDEIAPRAETLFVTANGWDASGALRVGRRVCWIDRGGEAPERSPTLVVRSLSELADYVCR